MKPPCCEGKCPIEKDPKEEDREMCVGLGQVAMWIGATSGVFEISLCVKEAAWRYISSPNEDVRQAVRDFSTGSTEMRYDQGAN